MTDAFDDWQENIRAIALGLEALRKVDRYGITSRGEQYTGWKALPSGEGEVYNVLTAANFLSVHGGMPASVIIADSDMRKVAYRRAAQKLHPDKGGDPALFNRLQKAKELLTNN
jgi:hypothetical protein